jgi:hypothetical protein
MAGSTSVWGLVAWTVGGAVALIALLFAGGWLFARYMRRQMSGLETIRAEWADHYRAHGDEIRRWHRLGIGLGLTVLGIVVVLLAARAWLVLVALYVLLIPVGLIIGGLSLIKMRYYWDNAPWRPVRVVTGRRAVRRGWISVVAGVLDLAWLLKQAADLGIFAF